MPAPEGRRWRDLFPVGPDSHSHWYRNLGQVMNRRRTPMLGKGRVSPEIGPSDAGRIYRPNFFDSGEDGTDNAARGVLSTHIYSDGRYYDMLYVDGGPGSTGTAGVLRMEGKEVFRHAVNRMAESVETALTHNNLTLDDIDWLVPHQANIRIIESIGRRLRLSLDNVVVTVDMQANTSAATIPLALTQAQNDGRLKAGNLVALSALGGGFSWGSALLRW